MLDITVEQLIVDIFYDQEYTIGSSRCLSDMQQTAGREIEHFWTTEHSGAVDKTGSRLTNR